MEGKLINFFWACTCIKGTGANGRCRHSLSVSTIRTVADTHTAAVVETVCILITDSFISTQWTRCSSRSMEIDPDVLTRARECQCTGLSGSLPPPPLFFLVTGICCWFLVVVFLLFPSSQFAYIMLCFSCYFVFFFFFFWCVFCLHPIRRRRCDFMWTVFFLLLEKAGVFGATTFFLPSFSWPAN